MPDRLIGIGLYTPAEAERLTGVRASKIVRWLHGHRIGDHQYEPLWASQIELEDGRVYLGFRDLMEVRVANAFIRRGLSPQKVRQAIQVARELIGEERPLSTARFRTDGRTVFLHVLEQEGDERLIDLFRKQFSFREILEPSLKNLELDDDGVPARWWPSGKSKRILVDPSRSFGQPIEADSGVPVAALALAAKAEQSVEAAAQAWRVSIASVRRAVEFQDSYDARIAA